MNGDAASAPRHALAWDDLKDGARELFKVWCLGSELEWAERAWGMLEKAGLTAYRDAVEETRVRVRLLALATIYWDFCRLGADESFGWDELNYHASESLEIGAFRLAQLAGPALDAGDYNAEESGLVESALRHLIVEERPAIGTALIKGHGDEWTFLKALFATIKTPPDPPEDDEPEFMRAAPVMGWIMEGMPC